MPPLHILDLNFQGQSHTIAAYLIPHSNGGILIETGPGSTIPGLTAGLRTHGFAPSDITHALLTHIHLDHAGAAGWLAQQGAHIYVHKIGVPHLLNPDRLLVSASRIYGDAMDTLWGDFLPVPADKLTSLSDGDTISIGSLQFTALDTPGHATHHMSYLLEDICFTGDVAGVRLPETAHVRVPAPPPEFHLEQWRQSLARLRTLDVNYLAPTHFGLFADPHTHLDALERALNHLETWMESTLPNNTDVEELKTHLTAWTYQTARAEGLSEDLWQAHEAINPIWMSASGIHRYWHRVRHGA
ncbi:MAG: MBL fold metallo-hydrolase [Anaerolineales bacterium]|nr:MBL fold metallo-hydrolase [Anaerolineales bacterium]